LAVLFDDAATEDAWRVGLAFEKCQAAGEGAGRDLVVCVGEHDVWRVDVGEAGVACCADALALREGSVRMIDATYGHLVRDAEEQDRDLLDAYDAAADQRGPAVGTNPGGGDDRGGLRDEKAPRERGFSASG
jgi:hypothetical protein